MIRLPRAAWIAIGVLLLIVIVQAFRDARTSRRAAVWRARVDSVLVVNAAVLASRDSFRLAQEVLSGELVMADAVTGRYRLEVDRLGGVIDALRRDVPPAPATVPAGCGPWAERAGALERLGDSLGALAVLQGDRAAHAELATQAANAGRLAALGRVDAVTEQLRVSDSLLRTVPRPNPVRLGLVLEGRARLAGTGEIVAGLNRGPWQVSAVLDHKARRTVEASYRRVLRVF